MKQLTGMLTALVSGISLLSVLVATIANAQGDETLPEPISALETPALEAVDSSLATDLTGLQERQTNLDYEFLFLPAGTGGERSGEPAQTNLQLEPSLSSYPTLDKPSPSPNLPPYSVIKPNRAIETQTDPQRLTVVAPASERQK